MDDCNHEFELQTFIQVDINFVPYKAAYEGAKPKCRLCGAEIEGKVDGIKYIPITEE